MTERWTVVYDGPSAPMLQSPDGGLYRIQRLELGQWQASPFEPGDSTAWCDALNLSKVVLAEQQLQYDASLQELIG